MFIGCNSDYNELAANLNDSISNKIDSVTFSDIFKTLVQLPYQYRQAKGCPTR